jgi:hypothetical protein
VSLLPLARRTLLVAALPGFAWAQGSDPVRAAIADAQAAGSTKLTYFGFEIYNAKLWVAPSFKRTSWEQSACALELNYLRAFKGPQIAQRSIDEMKKQASLSDAQSREWLMWLGEAIPDVARNDRLLGIYKPGSLAIWHNGRLRKETADAQLAERFMAIWLSPRSSQPKMREALLKGLA